MHVTRPENTGLIHTKISYQQLARGYQNETRCIAIQANMFACMKYFNQYQQRKVKAMSSFVIQCCTCVTKETGSKVGCFIGFITTLKKLADIEKSYSDEP